MPAQRGVSQFRGCFALAGGHGQQVEALPWEGGIAVGVLRQQPGGVGRVLAGDRSSWPPDLGYPLLEPREVVGIRPAGCRIIMSLTGRLVPFHPAQEFCTQVRSLHHRAHSPGGPQWTAL